MASNRMNLNSRVAISNIIHVSTEKGTFLMGPQWTQLPTEAYLAAIGEANGSTL